MQNGNPAQAFAIWVNQRFLDGRTNKEARGWTTLANVVDVECAAITKQGSVADMLAVRLNEYAEKLVLDRVGKDEIKADACGGRFPLLPLETIRDGSGRTVFTYRMSENPATAGRQRACITAQTRLQSTCSAR
jgi:hypothetical protein